MRTIRIAAILVIAVTLILSACTSKPSFEKQRIATVEYLRTFNKIDSDVNQVGASVMSSSFSPTTLKLLISALQGALQRCDGLKPQNIDTATHIDNYKRYLNTSITTLQNQLKMLSDVETIKNASDEEFKRMLAQLDADSNSLNTGQAEIWRLTESIMVKFNITDQEVNYQFRGKP